MDVREKLVELMNKVQDTGVIEIPAGFGTTYDWVKNEFVASQLIANGVTVQECGHWEDDHGDYVCSCCYTAFTDDLVWLVRGESNEPNYCPNCGAKMDGDSNG